MIRELAHLTLVSAFLLSPLVAQRDVVRDDTVIEFPTGLQDPAAKKDEGPSWAGSFALGASMSLGNTERRNANASAEAKRKSGQHRTNLGFLWTYSEEKSDDPALVDQGYILNERMVRGTLKQDYFLTESEKSYLFAELEGYSDYGSDIELRYTAVAGLGYQFIDDDTFFLLVEAGVGYFSETSRVDINPDTDGTTARVGWEFKWKLSESWSFQNLGKWFPSLEDPDDQYAILDTRLRANLSDKLFAQLQWIVNWDNTPPLDDSVPPQRNERTDHRLLLSIGWSF